jgi:hypothetical protein
LKPTRGSIRRALTSFVLFRHKTARYYHRLLAAT